jgi:PAS domain S-box-containing protein
MALRKKTLFAIATTLIGLNAALYAVSSSILLKNALQNEQSDARQGIIEMIKIFDKDRLQFQERWNDWSQWDDTYAFIQNRNQAYIASNLGNQQLVNLRIHAIAYINTSGQITYATGFDWEKKQRSPFPQLLEQRLTNGSLLNKSNLEDQLQPLTGIVMLPQAPMLITAQSILTSEAKGPALGTVVFGRYLDNTYLDHLSKLTGSNLKVFAYNDQNLPTDWQNAKTSLLNSSESRPIVIEFLSESVLATYSLFKDIDGKPALILRVEQNRASLQNAQLSIVQLMWWTIATGSIFGIVALVCLEKLVLSRVTHLDRAITAIGNTGDLSARIVLGGNDELTNVTDSMNKMLQVLEQHDREQEQSAIALQRSENQTQAILRAFPDLMIRLHRDGTYLDMKPGRHVKTLFPIETTIHKNIINFLPPDVYQQRMHHIKQALLTGEVQIFEYQLPIDGEMRDHEGRIAVSGEDEVLMIVRDINDRKAAELELQQSAMALRQSENQTQAILAAFPDLMMRLHRDGTYLDMKPGKAVKTLYPIETTMHKNTVDFLPPDVYQQRMYHIEQAFLTGEVQFFEYQLPIDGEMRDHEGRIAVSGEDEVLMIVRDINDRKRADRETQLLLALNKAINEAPDFDAALQALLEGVGEATSWHYGEAWSVSADGQVMECRSSHYCKPFEANAAVGAALQEFRTFSEGFSFLPNEGLVGRVWTSQNAEWIQDLAANPESFLRTEFALAADLNTCLGIPISIKDESTGYESHVIAVLVICTHRIREQDRRAVKLITDVANQLGSSIQQKRTDAELRALFRAMTDVIVTIDSQGHYLKVTQTNTTLLVGPADDLVGKTLYEVFERSQADRFMHRIWEVINTQQTLNTEYQLEINGRPIWFSANISPISEDSVIWVARDISDRKAAELELQQAKEDADAANKAKTNFLAKMSHELRTPLNAILGFTQLMVGDRGLTQEQRENLRIINNSGEHLLALINDVLEMSKIELGKISLNANSFDLYKLLDTIQDMVRQKADTKGLRLIFEGAQDLPQHIETDEIKLRQVLINLLTNAIKFTQTGSVILRASRTDTALPSSVVRLQFEVEDTGVGIASTENDRVFEIFAQTESGLKSNEGTGLGLPISLEIVRLMGGDISFTSQVGQGSMFRFDILANLVDLPETLSPDATSDHENQTPAVLRILLAEDNLVNQKVALKMLDKLGYSADIANNGLEALTCLAQNTYDLILMDVQMPEMNGLETTLEICRRWLPQERPIIIAMTAGAMYEDRDRCLAAGMNDYITKPIRIEELKVALERWCGVNSSW